MQSLIIVGKNTEKLSQEAEKICNENKISKFDIDILKTEKQVGIGDIRDLREKMFLRPLKGDKKALILEAFFGMTTEAQNAFLKLLEEPPLSTIILILVSSLDFILPTVLSRCTLINLEKNRVLTKDEEDSFLKLLETLKNDNSNALILAQNNSKSKEEALNFLEGLIIIAEKNLNLKNAKILKKLQETHTIIKSTNVNVRFALENLFLNI